MACVRKRKSFSFETVLDRQNNLEIIEKAKKVGYFTALYFIGTEGFQLNIERINHRVSKGGHDVPHNLVIGETIKNKSMFRRAVEIFDSVRIYDNTNNSEDGSTRPMLVVKKKGGNFLQLRPLPNWLAGTLDM